MICQSLLWLQEVARLLDFPLLLLLCAVGTSSRQAENAMIVQIELNLQLNTAVKLYNWIWLFDLCLARIMIAVFLGTGYVIFTNWLLIINLVRYTRGFFHWY